MSERDAAQQERLAARRGHGLVEITERDHSGRPGRVAFDCAVARR